MYDNLIHFYCHVQLFKTYVIIIQESSYNSVEHVDIRFFLSLH